MAPGLGYTEIAFIILLALVLVKPKDLPKVLRSVARFWRDARNFLWGLRDSLRSELDELQKLDGIKELKEIKDLDGIKDLKDLNCLNEIKEAAGPEGLAALRDPLGLKAQADPRSPAVSRGPSPAGLREGALSGAAAAGASLAAEPAEPVSAGTAEGPVSPEAKEPAAAADPMEEIYPELKGEGLSGGKDRPRRPYGAGPEGAEGPFPADGEAPQDGKAEEPAAPGGTGAVAASALRPAGEGGDG
ncbi:MAG: hypothetical protein LBW85_02960 [Deltaproteobacteria bacterium]|jgi:sec-independent protein translocase protein TatB|nr:hypothetical protein [Deltaproteobacteria bacterium]